MRWSLAHRAQRVGLAGQPVGGGIVAACLAYSPLAAGRLKVPALLTHGDDDPRVPISMSRGLKELKPSLVTFERFPAAGHLESWNIDRARCTSLAESFLVPVAS